MLQFPDVEAIRDTCDFGGNVFSKCLRSSHVKRSVRVVTETALVLGNLLFYIDISAAGAFAQHPSTWTADSTQRQVTADFAWSTPACLHP